VGRHVDPDLGRIRDPAHPTESSPAMNNGYPFCTWKLSGHRKGRSDQGEAGGEDTGGAE
jgi:hypothetical protein